MSNLNPDYTNLKAIKDSFVGSVAITYKTGRVTK